ncbi:hypothetical protein BN4901_1026 [Citrobacter europaeus]|uniref:Transposase n=1 Tax=Citrobacter europaeus TaxID=1914243 RepID=A0ABY0JXY0_9ENTR|nr:hypothetical protein CIP106467_3308 [Citrobacter europaeus]SCA75156.1 hypothetical protein BN4901_1026 [Citrobacter europaeus]
MREAAFSNAKAINVFYRRISDNHVPQRRMAATPYPAYVSRNL